LFPDSILTLIEPCKPGHTLRRWCPDMSNPAEQITAYVEALNAAGIPACIDYRDINPPAVQLRAPVMHFRFGRGCIAADWTARLILLNSGQEEAIKQAFDLIPKIQDALGGAIVDARPQDYDLPDGGGPAPGYELTWTTH
jgi:hypothetical protein